MKQIDQLISNIRFPADYQRKIPSLDDLKSFKASELKNLLLYGLIPCSFDQLGALAKARIQAADFLHWLILYHEICAALNVSSIRIEDLDFVDRLIHVWLQLVPIFLGE